MAPPEVNDDVNAKILESYFGVFPSPLGHVP